MGDLGSRYRLRRDPGDRVEAGRRDTSASARAGSGDRGVDRGAGSGRARGPAHRNALVAALTEGTRASLGDRRGGAAADAECDAPDRRALRGRPTGLPGARRAHRPHRPLRPRGAGAVDGKRAGVSDLHGARARE